MSKNQYHHFFLRRFLKNPCTVGAISPSSATLSRAMLRAGKVDRASVVVELGAGTGAISKYLLHAVSPECKLLAIERDPQMCDFLTQKMPDLPLCCGDAADLGNILQTRQIDAPNAIISALPWSVLDRELQRQILSQIVANLAPGGSFVTFAYLSGLMLPAAMHFRELLDEFFDHREITTTVWRNLPPAVIYRCWQN